MEANSYILCNCKSECIGLYSSVHSLRPEQLLITEKRSVYIYEIEDKKCSAMWTLSPTSKSQLSGSAIRDSTSKLFYVVDQQNTLVSWKIDSTGELEKANKKQVESAVFKLLEHNKLRGNIVIVFENGGIMLMNSKNEEKVIVNGNGKNKLVKWCKLQGVADSAWLTVLHEDNTLHCYELKRDDKDIVLASETKITLTPPQKNVKLLSLDSLGQFNELSLFWSDGTFQAFKTNFHLQEIQLKIERQTSTYAIPQKAQFLDVLSLSYRETLTLLCGKSKETNNATITVWTNNFGTVQGHHTVKAEAKKIVEVVKILGDNGVAIATENGVYVCSMYSHRASLASVLGSMENTSKFLQNPDSVLQPASYSIEQLGTQPQLKQPPHLTIDGIQCFNINENEWSYGNSDAQKDAVLSLCKSSDKVLTTQWDSFKQKFIATRQISQWSVAKLANYSLQKKSWSILQDLFACRLSSNSCPELISTLITEKKLDLLTTAIRSIRDITAIQLVDVVRFILAEVKANPSKLADLQPTLNAVISYPVTEIYIARALKSLTPEDSMALFRILGDALSKDACPVSGAITWLSTIIDSHFLEIILNKEFHGYLFTIRTILQNQIRLTEKVMDLQGPLDLLSKDQHNTPSPAPGARQYTIETLIL